MRTSQSILIALALTLPTLSYAASIEGISFPDQVTVQGQKLSIHGLGLRLASAFKIRIFAGVLYAPSPKHTAEDLLKNIRPLQFSELYFRDISRSISNGPFRSLLKEVAGAEYPLVEKEVDAFIEWLPSFEKDGGMTVTFMKEALQVEVIGKNPAKPPFKGSGKFSDIMLRIWLGSVADADLKKGLLGL